MPTLYNNNAFSTLAAAITSSGQTSVTVQTGHGDRFPIIVSPDVAFITLENTAGTREVIKITARAATSDVLTVTRGEEGTSATTWAIGDLIEQRITAGELTDFRTRPGFTTTATSAGTLTLTKGSTEIQTLTGSTTHTVVLPVVSTLYTGKSFTINNNSTGIVTVNSSGSNAVVAIQPGNSADIICVLITGTTAASWTVMTAFGASNGALPGTLSVGGTATMAAINASGTVAMAGAATVGTTLGVTGTSTMAAINASGTIATTAGNINSVLAQNSASGLSASNSTNGTSARAYTLLISSAGNGGIAANSPLYSDFAGAGDSLTIFASGLSGGIQHIIDGGSSQLTVASTGVTIPGTLGVTGASTFNGLAKFDIGNVTGTLGQNSQSNIHLGNAGGAIGNLVQIAMGYQAGNTNSPAAIGFVATSAAGNTKGDLIFGTRDVTTDTAPTERMRLTSAGYLKASPDPAILFNATGAYHEFNGNSASVGAFRTRSQSATFAGTAALIYADRAASALFNLLDMQSGGVNKFLVDGTGNTTISGTVQPTLLLAKTNATATTWQIYNNGNLVFYDGTNYPLYFVGADSTFGGIITAKGAAYGANTSTFNSAAADFSLATQNSHATSPYGHTIKYSAAAPNTTGTASVFIYMADTGAVRAYFSSNGGLGNYSANNQNLSDETVKSDFIAMPSFRDEFAAMHGKWTRYKYLDQTHSDYNSGYRAQDIRDVFGAKAPELVDWWETETRIEVEDAETGKKTNKMVPIPESERKLAVYNDDLHNIAMSVLSELIIEQNTLREEFQSYKNSHP